MELNFFFAISTGIFIILFIKDFVLNFLLVKDQTYGLAALYSLSLYILNWKYFINDGTSSSFFLFLFAIISIAFFKKDSYLLLFKYKFNPYLNILEILYVILLLISIFFNLKEMYSISITIIGLLFIVAIFISGLKEMPRFYFLKAITYLSSFVGAIFLFLILKNHFLFKNLYYGFPICSLIQVIFISLSNADKILIYKQEKEESQAEALRVSQENETLIREQNIILEKKVAERTEELRTANHQLNKTLVELKDAQNQLVETEKMSSLNILLSGIAHEVRNPLNYINSAILSINKQSLKYTGEHENKVIVVSDITEIIKMISIIEQGIDRINDIIKSISFGDTENKLIETSINEILRKVILFLKQMNSESIQFFESYGDIPILKTFATKFDQVFLNLLQNSIQAIHPKIKNGFVGKIEVYTITIENKIRIVIKDNGVGINSIDLNKIYDPFFTTKKIGEDTGLGLSLVYKVIHQHRGTINVISEIDRGTEFTIELPFDL